MLATYTPCQKNKKANSILKPLSLGKGQSGDVVHKASSVKPDLYQDNTWRTALCSLTVKGLKPHCALPLGCNKGTKMTPEEEEIFQ